MIRNTLAVATVVLGLGALGACAKEETSQGAATVTSSTTAPTSETTQTGASIPATGPMGAGAAATPAMASNCPMAVSGTSVETKETPTGMNMIFKTTGDVTELRRRVRDMATQMSTGAGGATGAAGAGGMMMMAGMPPVRALARDIDGGAQIEMTPVDATNLGAMRQHLQNGAQMMMAQRQCPMRSMPK